MPERDKSELLGEHELDLQVANGTAFLYDGWIEVAFQLLGEYGQSEPITVPIRGVGKITKNISFLDLMSSKRYM